MRGGRQAIRGPVRSWPCARRGLYRSAGFVDLPPYNGSSMQDYQTDAMLSRYLDSVAFMEQRP